MTSICQFQTDPDIYVHYVKKWVFIKKKNVPLGSILSNKSGKRPSLCMWNIYRITGMGFCFKIFSDSDLVKLDLV